MKTKTEGEILERILEFARADDRIRVVIMNGSRANPHGIKDPFQDFDIANFVTVVAPFTDGDYVIPHFGEMLVVEQPNIGPWPPADADGSYHNYNMQLLDGNRIDLSFFPIGALAYRAMDSLTKVLLDKDSLCTDFPEPSERSYFIKPPTEELFAGCCTGFFFALGSHIPKTIWRKRLPLLKFYIEGWLREPLLMMLSWEIGIKKGFAISIGPKGKYLQEYLEPDVWDKYVQTFVGPDYDRLWHSLFLFHEIFETSARYVAEERGYMYPKEQAKRVYEFLMHVRDLPADADTIYR